MVPLKDSVELYKIEYTLGGNVSLACSKSYWEICFMSMTTGSPTVAKEAPTKAAQTKRANMRTTIHMGKTKVIGSFFNALLPSRMTSMEREILRLMAIKTQSMTKRTAVTV